MGQVTHVYPEKSYLTLNLDTAQKSGLQVSDAVIRSANRVVR